MARSRECRICGKELRESDDDLSLTELPLHPEFISKYPKRKAAE